MAKATQSAQAKKAVKKPVVKAVVVKKLTASEKLTALGIEAICGRLAAGESQRSIAESVGVQTSGLCEWLAADAERSARAREARSASARHWDDQAEAAIIAADETLPGSIAKARELASHYRWRASKYAPKDYGDKLDLTANVNQTMTLDQVEAQIIRLTAKLNSSSE